MIVRPLLALEPVFRYNILILSVFNLIEEAISNG